MRLLCITSLPFQLSEPGRAAVSAWALLVKVWTWCHSELYLCLIFLTNTPPILKKTHSHTDRLLVSLTHAGSPFLPPPFLLFPLPCQHKPVMWLSQIMRWEFYCNSLWAWHQSVRMTATASVRALWYRAPSVDCYELMLDTQPALSGPPAMHFKVGDQGSTCAWHPENDNASASLHLLLRASPQDTKACRQLPHYLALWRKCSFRSGIYIQEEGSALSVFYTNTGGPKQCEGQRKDRPTRQSGNRFLAVSCLIAQAFIDKIQHHTTYL